VRRHPVDPLSAALGIIAVVLGVLVATDQLDELGSDTGAWITAAVLLVGLGLLPWSRRRNRGAPADDTAPEV
jgi:MYXO-CTERM domain-containing protein